MKSTFKIFVGVALMVLATVSQAQAQKFGYVDSGSILQAMSEVKEAESNLEALNKQLQAKGQKMMEDYQFKVQSLQQKIQAGDITPKDQEAQETMLLTERDKIVAFEQDMQKQLNEKREMLLTPILEKIRVSIQEVAKENGYTYVFDGSPGVGVLLYAEENTNITSLVKAKLNIQ